MLWQLWCQSPESGYAQCTLPSFHTVNRVGRGPQKKDGKRRFLRFLQVRCVGVQWRLVGQTCRHKPEVDLIYRFPGAGSCKQESIFNFKYMFIFRIKKKKIISFFCWQKMRLQQDCALKISALFQSSVLLCIQHQVQMCLIQASSRQNIKSELLA